MTPAEQHPELDADLGAQPASQHASGPLVSGDRVPDQDDKQVATGVPQPVDVRKADGATPAAGSDDEPSSGSTSLQRSVLRRSSKQRLSGAQLVAAQQDWDAKHATDPAEVPQGPNQGQPDGLPRLLAVLLSIAAAGIVILIFHQLAWLLGPVFLGLTLLIAVYPVYTVLANRGLPRWLAMIALTLVLLAILTIGVLAATWAIGSIVNKVPSYLPAVNSMWNGLLGWLASVGVDTTALRTVGSKIDPNSVLGALGTMLSSVSGVIGAVTLLLSALLMMLIDAGGWMDRLNLAGESHPRVIAAMRSFAHGVRKYWVVSCIFGAIMASLNWIELTVLHVPLAGVWVMLTFVTTFIPNIGFFFAMVPPVLIALVANGWQNAVTLMALYFITTWIVQGIFQPKFAGNAIGVNTTISFLSFLLWAWVFGPIGTLIALPLTQLVKALLIDADPKARWLNALFASVPSSKGAAGQD